MHDLTNRLLGFGAVIIGIGAMFLVSQLYQNPLYLVSTSDFTKFYSAYFIIIIVGAIPLGIFLGLFDYLLYEMFGY